MTHMQLYIIGYIAISIYSSHGSVSVFQVGIGFRFFVRFFKKSVRFSVSVFLNIAISVSVFRFFRSLILIVYSMVHGL
jgi:hypothetical protein